MSMKRIELTIDGAKQVVYAQKMQSTLWVHYNGKIMTYEPELRSRKGKGAAGAGVFDGSLKAPMPGKITKVLASAGTLAKTGHGLIVMEAMKMEYSIKAPQDGTVAEVLCKVGDQVTLGQVLLKYK